MKIKVVNWDSHQERADRGNYIWFKFYNKFWEDTKIHGLSVHAKLLFIYCLSVCSKNNGDTVEMVPAIAMALTGLKTLPFADLVGAGLLQEIPGMSSQEEMNRIEEKRYTPDLESVYQLYPKRPGQEKRRGMQKLERAIKTPEDFDRLKRAVCNYAKYCEAECVQPKYVKMWATFAGCWEDWVNQDPPLMKKGDWHG